MLSVLRPDAAHKSDMVIALAAEGQDAGWLRNYGLDGLPGLEDVKGKKDELTVLRPAPGAIAARVCLAGLGSLDGLPEDLFLERVRQALASAVRKAAALKLRHGTVLLDNVLDECGGDRERLIREAAFALCAGPYRYVALKTEPEEITLERLDLLVPEPDEPSIRAAARGQAEAEAVALAKNLVNTPPNLMTPLTIAEQARTLSAELPLACTVLDRNLLEEAGLNALLAVGRGSVNESVLICLEYAPAGHEADDPIVLVGKGLTFDSGGISLKPSAGMHEMKSDMAGAAAVLAVLALTARCRGNRRVIGLLPCAENMPDALAVRPGDVVRTLKGTQVEILNTDAEGRLALCDALTYAQQQWQPACLVDIATLTGACVVALGTRVAGLFANDDPLAEDLAAAGLLLGERFWRLPVWDLYAEGLKSETADLGNVGGREGGAVTAALFLKHFVNDGIRWAHLDIAGPAFKGKNPADGSAGATGFGVRTLAWLAGI